MNATTQRYAPGGDIYARLVQDYGPGGADYVFEAAKRAEAADDPSLIGDALGVLKWGTPPETSTIKLFGQQIATDPLGAPLEAVSNVAEKTVANFFNFQNWGLWVLLAGAGLFLWLKYGRT